MDDLYRALADPTRRAILDELVERDGQTLFELCGRLTMKHGIGSSRQAISQHLEVLEAAGLVSTKREGRYKFLSFHGEPLQEIARRWPATSAPKSPAQGSSNPSSKPPSKPPPKTAPPSKKQRSEPEC